MRVIYSLTIYSLPFWSLPFLPGTYSAVTPYLSAIVGFWGMYRIILKKKIHLVLCAFAMFFLFLLVFYSILSVGLYGPSVFIKTMSYIIGFFSIVGFYTIINDKGIDYVKTRLLSSAVFVAIIALIELASTYFGLSSVKYFLNMVFSGNVSSKVILTTSEPSWAVQLILFCSAILIFSYRNSKNKILIFFVLTNLLVFILLFSLTGFLVLFFSLIVYFTLFQKISFGRVFVLFVIFVIFMFFGYISYMYGSDTVGGYTYSRIEKLFSLAGDNLFSLYFALISIDNSLLVRIGYPVVAFNMMIDNPFGVGINGFAHNLKDYLYLLHTANVGDSELTQHLIKLNADTRNYYLAFGTDFGYLGLFFILSFHVYLAKKIRLLKDNRLICAVLFSLSVGMMMQFSTQHFAVYSFVYALIMACFNNEKKNFNYNS